MGTGKKSTETDDLTCLSRKVRKVGEGGLGSADILADLGLTEVDAELQQLTVDARSIPERVVAALGRSVGERR